MSLNKHPAAQVSRGPQCSHSVGPWVFHLRSDHLPKKRVAQQQRLAQSTLLLGSASLCAYSERIWDSASAGHGTLGTQNDEDNSTGSTSERDGMGCVTWS